MSTEHKTNKHILESDLEAQIRKGKYIAECADESDEDNDDEYEEEEFSSDDYERDPNIPEEESVDVIQTEMPEDDDLSLYFNRVNIQGRLYFKDELKISNTKIGGHVASFNLLIKKKSKNGPKKHKIYIKTYNGDAIEWLENQKNWTWIKIEGSLEVAGGKNYVNAKTITALSEEQLIAMNTSNEVLPKMADTSISDIASNEDEISLDNTNEVVKKLKCIQRQNKIISDHGKMFISSKDDDEAIALVTIDTELRKKDIAELRKRTRDLFGSDDSDKNQIRKRNIRNAPGRWEEDDDDDDDDESYEPIRSNQSDMRQRERSFIRKRGGYYDEQDDKISKFAELNEIANHDLYSEDEESDEDEFEDIQEEDLYVPRKKQTYSSYDEQDYSPRRNRLSKNTYLREKNEDVPYNQVTEKKNISVRETENKSHTIYEKLGNNISVLGVVKSSNQTKTNEIKNKPKRIMRRVVKRN